MTLYLSSSRIVMVIRSVAAIESLRRRENGSRIAYAPQKRTSELG
jgi:hypothetical protein